MTQQARNVARRDKLLDKLSNPASTMTWGELVALMGQHGFEVLNARGGGSGRKFHHREKDLLVRLHEPHPSKELKPYVKADAMAALREVGVDV